MLLTRALASFAVLVVRMLALADHDTTQLRNLEKNEKTKRHSGAGEAGDRMQHIVLRAQEGL